MAPKKIDDLDFKVIGKTIEVYDGEKMIGYVTPVTAHTNRFTGTWCYTIPNYKMGVSYNCNGASEPHLIDYVNWNAGKSYDVAILKLGHKLGYK